MPYKSQAQERYFNANRAELEKKGVNVGEWNSASKGMKLPKKANSKSNDMETKNMGGNPIHLNPAHKGRLTAAAKEHGFSNVQKFANHVHSNPQLYSKALHKEAGFARAERKWKH